MPMKFAVPKAIVDSPMAETLSCAGINIRLGNEQIVTFYVSAFDAQDKLIHTEPINVLIQDLKSDPDFAVVYAALKRIAYEKVADRFGAGTVS